MSEGLVIDLAEMFKVLNDIMNTANPQDSKSETKSESDMINKYKKLYEASVTLQNLKNKKERVEELITTYQDELKRLNTQIDELNKLFSN